MQSHLDLARMVFLYDQGGISIDIDHIPGPGFLNSTLFGSNPVPATDSPYQGQFLIEEGGDHPYPRLIASEPKHHALHMVLLGSIASQNQQFTNISALVGYKRRRRGIYEMGYNTIRNDIKYGSIFFPFFTEKDLNGTIGRKHSSDLLTQIPLSDKTRDSIKFIESSKGCVDLLNDSYEVDVESLLKVAGGHGHSDNGTCPEGLTYISNTFLPESIVKGRKIPKIIHMTSKSKCVTKLFANNMEQWRFKGHSFFLHDNAAVDRLFNEEWPEFPLLKHIRSCLNSGAGLADLWRYLLIWRYGGVYTDMDDLPGTWDDGNMISDDDDAFFEVDVHKQPSQYYFAG